MKRIIISVALTLSTLFIMAVIFYFSSQTGVESEQVSGAIMLKFKEILLRIIGTGEIQSRIYEELEFVIRKSAHVFLYLFLGFFVAATLTNYGINKNLVLITLIFCFLYASADEIHQHFVDGRSGEFTDVLLDTAGSSIGLYIYLLSRKRAKTPPHKHHL